VGKLSTSSSILLAFRLGITFGLGAITSIYEHKHDLAQKMKLKLKE
jgi:hypothetical protein